MELASEIRTTPKGMLWTGRIMSIIVILFMAFDVFIHLFPTQSTVDALARLAIDPTLAPVLGTIAFVCVALYAIPRTAFLGAVLLATRM
jgi:hypothetical protein